MNEPAMPAADYLNRCHFGDARGVLRQMIVASVRVNTIVTSPPYWGLRSYLPDGHPDKMLEIGHEPTIGKFIATLVEVFDLCRRVLRDDGTLFVNMGDSYAANRGYQVASTLMGGDATNQAQRADGRGMKAASQGLKPKDLVGQPWRLAFALQRAGWWLRQDIIWHKPNPMPESVRDRCTKAHEYIFLLSKSERYHFDQESILEPVSPNTHARLSQDVQNQIGSARANGGAKTNGNMKAVGRIPGNVNPPKGQAAYEAGVEQHRTKAGLLAYARKLADTASGAKSNVSFDEAMAIMPTRRNKRSVWTVASDPYRGAHFATFPCKLIEPCILAGCPIGGIVLDPFGGSGTTAQVAKALGRNWILIDLNRANAPLLAERLR